MHCHIIAVGAFEVNCAILSQPSGRAWICDPGGDPETIADWIQRRRLTVAGYLLTHGHIDHISALEPLLGRYAAPVFLHPRDAEWAFTPLNHIDPYPVLSGSPALLRTDFTGTFAGLADGPRLQVLETPGHTPGSVCLWFPDDNLVLSGDTLFAGSVGRTDLPGGDSRQLATSLKSLKMLPPTVRVIPGHGPATTLEREWRVNPFLTSGGEGQP